MGPFFDNRAENYLRGTCTGTSCAYWHPPECQFSQNESGCKAGDKCLFPHHKVDEQPNKKQKKSDHSPKKKRKRRQECSGYCETCISDGLCLARLGVIGFSKRQNKPGETRCKKSWDRFEEYDSLSLRYVKRVSGKRKEHRLEKYKSKTLISEVPTP